jgi:hypothetical protein
MPAGQPSTWFTPSQLDNAPQCQGHGDSTARIRKGRNLSGDSFLLESMPLAHNHSISVHQRRQQRLEDIVPKAARDCLRRAADAVSQASSALQQAPRSFESRQQSNSCRDGKAGGSRSHEGKAPAEVPNQGRKPRKQLPSPLAGLFASASAAAGPKEWKWPNFLQQWKPPRCAVGRSYG